MDLILNILSLLGIKPEDAVRTIVGGAFGGLALILFSLRNGHYKNNKYIWKFSIEFLGATTLAFCLGPLIAEKFIIPGSFGVGLSWVKIIQTARTDITKVVLKAILKGYAEVN